MKTLILATLAIAALSVAAPSVEATHGGARVRVFSNGTVIVEGGGVRVFRGGNVSRFNQDGGRNRIGFRR